jgi:hypothetical protein
VLGTLKRRGRGRYVQVHGASQRANRSVDRSRAGLRLCARPQVVVSLIAIIRVRRSRFCYQLVEGPDGYQIAVLTPLV